MSTADIPPNQTIYLNNLNERIKQEELKRSLYAAFSQFGKVLDVVTMRTYRLRGQAWIVFEDVVSATNAMRQMQGFPFYDKPIRIAFCKTKSDAAAKADGTYVPRDKAEERKRKAAEREKDNKKQKEAKEAASQNQPQQTSAAPPPATGDASSEPGLPNKILFVQNLPLQTNEMMLSMLFQQFPGYKEVRMIEQKPGIAFVEFETEMQAGVAMTGLQNFKITPQNSM
mmetsp:Transcript_12777/g.46738  ORF Transcript_12777/g.46738 Transcript_12777/m.46738 type:complete len:227 (-) Transcript_12777:40-720(-)